MESFTDLKAFRKRAYSLLGNGKDSLCDLNGCGAHQSRGCRVLPNCRSPLSFGENGPAFTRCWNGVNYRRQSLMELYVEHLPETERVILAGDHTAWPRLWANTLPGAHPRTPAVPQSGRHPGDSVGQDTAAWSACRKWPAVGFYPYCMNASRASESPSHQSGRPN